MKTDKILGSALSFVMLVGCSSGTVESTNGSPRIPDDAGSPNSQDGSVVSMDGSVRLPSVGAEQRCNDLGANCQCSEPLNAFQTVSNGWNDPVGSTDRECGGSLGPLYLSNGGAVVEPRGMPASSQVAYVWDVPSRTPNNNTFESGKSIPAGTKRACVRLYQQLSADHSDTCAPREDCACKRVKIQTFKSSSPDHFRVQTTFQQGEIITNYYVTDASGRLLRDKLLDHTSGPGFVLDDCREPEWCRVEMCLDGELEVTNSSGIEPEVRVTQLSTGRTMVMKDELGKVVGADTRLLDHHIGMMLTEGGDCQGSRRISHGMQAAWTEPGDHWIGPAYEIEGR